MPLQLASLFFQQQQSVIIPSIGKSESTDSTIDVKHTKAKIMPRIETRSPSPTQDSTPPRSIWRSQSSSSAQSSDSDDDDRFDMFAIRRCNAFEEDSDDEEDC